MSYMIANNLNDRISELERQLAEAQAELERIALRQRDDEGQLCRISRYLAKDARHVEGGGEHSISTLVEQEFSRLQAENTALRAELRQFREALSEFSTQQAARAAGGEHE